MTWGLQSLQCSHSRRLLPLLRFLRLLLRYLTSLPLLDAAASSAAGASSSTAASAQSHPAAIPRLRPLQKPVPESGIDLDAAEFYVPLDAKHVSWASISNDDLVFQQASDADLPRVRDLIEAWAMPNLQKQQTFLNTIHTVSQEAAHSAQNIHLCASERSQFHLQSRTAG